MTGVQLFYLFSEYSEYKVAVKLSSNYEPVFPSVTNAAPISPSSFSFNGKWNPYFEKWVDFTNQAYWTYGNVVTARSNTIKRLMSLRGLYENIDYELIKPIVHSNNNMILNCEYLGQPCNITEDFTLQPSPDFF